MREHPTTSKGEKRYSRVLTGSSVNSEQMLSPLPSHAPSQMNELALEEKIIEIFGRCMQQMQSQKPFELSSLRSNFDHS